MSHAMGKIRFQDGEVWYYEYNGTVDYAISYIHRTKEDVIMYWRTYEHKECECGRKEPVSIYSSYGGGFYFDGEACRNCKSLSHDHDEEDWSVTGTIDHPQDDWARKEDI